MMSRLSRASPQSIKGNDRVILVTTNTYFSCQSVSVSVCVRVSLCPKNMYWLLLSSITLSLPFMDCGEAREMELLSRVSSAPKTGSY